MIGIGCIYFVIAFIIFDHWSKFFCCVIVFYSTSSSCSIDQLKRSNALYPCFQIWGQWISYPTKFKTIFTFCWFWWRMDLIECHFSFFKKLKSLQRNQSYSYVEFICLKWKKMENKDPITTASGKRIFSIFIIIRKKKYRKRIWNKNVENSNLQISGKKNRLLQKAHICVF